MTPRNTLATLVAGAVFLGTACQAHAESRAPLLVGHYSNQEWSPGEDPHALSGYTVNLYKQGKVLFGDIGVAIGSAEPAQAKLYDIAFDEKAGTILFKAKYSEGIELGKDLPPEGREVKIILTFSGTLDRRRLQGEFVRRDGYPPFPSVGIEQAVLLRVNDKFVPRSVEEWKQDSK